MLNRSRLPINVRNKLWAECARTATDAENVSLKIGKDMPPHKEFFGKDTKNHTGDVHRLLNMETKRVVFSRDVRWLNQDYREHMKTQGLTIEDDEEEIIEDDEAEKDVV